MIKNAKVNEILKTPNAKNEKMFFWVSRKSCGIDYNSSSIKLSLRF